MNALVIAADGRMPYSEAAVAAANESAAQRARGDRSPKHVAADEATRLRWLGDVIPVRPIEKVVSVGDLVLLLGVAAAVAGGMAAGQAQLAGGRWRRSAGSDKRNPSVGAAG